MKRARSPAIIQAVVAGAPGPVSVFVVDDHGELIAAATIDGAAPTSANTHAANDKGFQIGRL